MTTEHNWLFDITGPSSMEPCKQCLSNVPLGKSRGRIYPLLPQSIGQKFHSTELILLHTQVYRCEGCCEFLCLCLGIKEVPEQQANGVQHAREAKCCQVVPLWHCLTAGAERSKVVDENGLVQPTPVPSSLLCPLSSGSLSLLWNLYFPKSKMLSLFFPEGEV